MSKAIEGDFPAILSNQEGYDALLQRANIQCLKNPAGYAIYGFADLVDGMAYTAGPERRAEFKGRIFRFCDVQVVIVRVKIV